jgi:hypothetical protein
MANGHGGARPGAGRPAGAKDKATCKRIARLRAAANAYLKTNDAAVFEGDSLGLAIAVYRNEDLPLVTRLHAVSIAIPFEHPRLNAVDARITLEQSGSSGDDYGDALLSAIERHYRVAEQKFVPLPQVLPPAPVVAKHAPRPPTIDGELAQHECNTAEKAEQSQQVADGYAEMESATLDAAPQPERANGEPAATPVDSPIDPDAIEVNIPTRSGWITRYVPRVK